MISVREAKGIEREATQHPASGFLFSLRHFGHSPHNSVKVRRNNIHYTP